MGYANQVITQPDWMNIHRFENFIVRSSQNKVSIDLLKNAQEQNTVEPVNQDT